MKSLLSLRGICIILLLTILASCTTRKEIAYIQDVEYGREASFTPIEPQIQPGDILGITVNSKNPELVAPFNLPMVGYYRPRGIQEASITRLQGYTVESDGSIAFPILGRIKAAGKTRIQLSREIETLLHKGQLVNDALVTTNFLNFRVSVLGEVARPGSFLIDNDRVSILDAIALAGDLTLQARRDNVVLLREIDGKRTAYKIDLRNASLLESPLFYLNQNDILLVEPNKTKIQNAGINTYTSISTWLSVLSTGTSMAAFIITLSNSSNRSK